MAAVVRRPARGGGGVGAAATHGRGEHGGRGVAAGHGRGGCGGRGATAGHGRRGADAAAGEAPRPEDQG